MTDPEVSKIFHESGFTEDPAGACVMHAFILQTKWQEINARPAQIPGNGKTGWAIHTYLGGRGSGKTRAAAEWIVRRCLEHAGERAAVLAMDWGAFENVCVLGESGIMSVLGDDSLAEYQIMKKRVVFANGSQIQGFTSEKPKKLRGPQHHCLWIDEPADLFDGEQCLSNARPGVRLPGPEPAQIFITGTPANVPIIQEIHRLNREDPDSYTISHGSMRENEANLDPLTVREMYSRYAPGSTFYEQEIEGRFVEHAEGALWQPAWVDANTVAWEDVPPLDVIAIGIDPADSKSEHGDECGLIVGGVAGDTGYVLADYTLRASMLEWTEQLPAIQAALGASVGVVEGNFGGETMRTLLERVETETAGALRFETVTARGDKATRARPIAALDQAGRIKHVVGAPGPDLDRLHSEMFTWEPGTNARSPNRIDAYAHLFTKLLLHGGGFHASRPRRNPNVTRQRRRRS